MKPAASTFWLVATTGDNTESNEIWTDGEHNAESNEIWTDGEGIPHP